MRSKKGRGLDFKERNDSNPSGLSVVILHYNRPWCLEIATSSLKKALEHWTLPHEIILADDGSDSELWPFLDRLPLDEVYIQPNRIYDGKQSSVYFTIKEAYKLARYPFVLFLEDDFWLIPQGFQDRGKSHLEGLLSRPEFHVNSNPLAGAVDLLTQIPEAHFIELARSFTNPRYHCLPQSERIFGGIAFRAKSQAHHPRFYTCAWPHIQRTEEFLSTPLPLGRTCWDGELELAQTRLKVFNSRDWVYNPEKCFFVHVNIFTWRDVYNRAGAKSHMRWSDVEDGNKIPFTFEPVKGFNMLLLQGFKKGIVRNDLDAYHTMSPVEYVYRMFYRRINP